MWYPNNNPNSGQPNGQPTYQPPTGYNGWQPNGQTNYQPNGNPVYNWPTTGDSNVPSDYNYNVPNNLNNVPPMQPAFDPQAELYRQATKRAEAKLHFYKHLRSYIVVNIILWGIAILTGLHSFGHSWSFWAVGWPIWVTAFWGIGLVSEYINVFVINENRKQKMIDEEMNRLYYRNWTDKHL